jgi:hypothetical protein
VASLWREDEILPAERLHPLAGTKNKSDIAVIAGTIVGWLYWPPCPILDIRQPVNSMTKILLATVAVLAFAAPAFAAEPVRPAEPSKTVGQAPPSGAGSFYLTQDSSTMKCEIASAQPAAGGTVKTIGAALPTQAAAQTALAAEKTCK